MCAIKFWWRERCEHLAVRALPVPKKEREVEGKKGISPWTKNGPTNQGVKYTGQTEKLQYADCFVCPCLF